MRITPFIVFLRSLGAAAAIWVAPAGLRAQCNEAEAAVVDGRVRGGQGRVQPGGGKHYTFNSAEDSLSWVHAKALAARSDGFRVIVSLKDCHVWAIIGRDTVLTAPAAVAKGTTLRFGTAKWKFDTPRGIRTVLGKESDPIWQPPEWLYAETASEHNLRLGHVSASRPIRLSDGRTVTVRGHEVGIIDNGQFAAMPTNEHIVFGDTLFVPPLGTRNRMVEGELGKYRLILGDGYLLHGTPYSQSIGMAATHGCVRLRDGDIEWMYAHIPIGTRIYIF